MGHLNITRLLIGCGVDANIKVSVTASGLDGVCPLHLAAKGGGNNHYEVVKYLVTKANVDLDVMDGDRNTPLHVAALYGHVQMVEFLVESGASVNLVNASNETPLDMARRGNQHHIEQYLLPHTAASHVYSNNSNISLPSINPSASSSTPTSDTHKSSLLATTWPSNATTTLPSITGASNVSGCLFNMSQYDRQPFSSPLPFPQHHHYHYYPTTL